MLMDIGQESLEIIVKDGVKEMMGKIGDRNRNAKRRSWVIAVKNAVKEYQQQIQQEFLPVLVNDFSRELVVKFSGGKLCEEDIQKIKKFMEMVEKSSIRKILEELLKKIDGVKVDGKDELNEKLEDVKVVIVEGHKWIFRRVELHVRSVISDTMYKKSVERSKIEVMLYNFVDDEVPENMRELFRNGMDSVPSYRMTKREIDSRVEIALLEYIMRLGKRRFYGNAVVHASSVQDWISKMKILNPNEETKDFVEKLEESLPGLKAELTLVYNDVDLDTKEEMLKKLEKRDWVLVMCDKNMGLSLFTLDTMRKADEALMKQLGAVRMENTTKEEIIGNVMKEIEKFEENLTLQHEEYLNKAYGSRFSDMNNASFPFLKSLHKIHKMSEEEIKEKDLGKLKFRPVVDAKKWLTRGYAGLAMQMMREANNLLVMSGGPVLKKLKPKDGWRFAVDIRDYKVGEEFDVVVTADIINNIYYFPLANDQYQLIQSLCQDAKALWKII